MARFEIERDLRRALQRDEFELHYQPIVAPGSGHVPSAPRRSCAGATRRAGIVQPLEFIRVAEELGLIQPIGCLVFEQASSSSRGGTT